jgi:hypothetical protein
LQQRRKANREYQSSREAKLDHADRQQAYCQRRKPNLKKVTGQGSEAATPSVTIDSALVSTGFPMKSADQPAREAPHARPKSLPACQKASSGLVSCIVCGRTALWTALFPRLP